MTLRWSRFGVLSGNSQELAELSISAGNGTMVAGAGQPQPPPNGIIKHIPFTIDTQLDIKVSSS